MTRFTPFDVADYLDDEETISAYLTAALADPDPDTSGSDWIDFQLKTRNQINCI